MLPNASAKAFTSPIVSIRGNGGFFEPVWTWHFAGTFKFKISWMFWNRWLKASLNTESIEVAKLTVQKVPDRDHFRPSWEKKWSRWRSRLWLICYYWALENVSLILRWVYYGHPSAVGTHPAEDVSNPLGLNYLCAEAPDLSHFAPSGRVGSESDARCDSNSNLPDTG